MTGPASTVFLLDVDNTLLDNDAVEADLRRHLVAQLGSKLADGYWKAFEELRDELGYADYLGALQRVRSAYPHETQLLETSAFLIEYPFAERVYPGAIETLHRLNERGRTVILSDGDAVFQPHKIRRSGLWAAVDGDVLVYVHKERELDDVEQRYPAEHYVIVDDKLRILDSIKRSGTNGRRPSFSARAITPPTSRHSKPFPLPTSRLTASANSSTRSSEQTLSRPGRASGPRVRPASRAAASRLLRSDRIAGVVERTAWRRCPW
jgi:FMN phosphatase YigB (HAD superfamily)